MTIQLLYFSLLFSTLNRIGDAGEHCDQFRDPDLKINKSLTISRYLTACTTLGTDTVYYVHLLKKGEPETVKSLIFSYSMSSSSTQPKIDFENNQKIIISVKNLFQINHIKNESNGITIKYQIEKQEYPYLDVYDSSRKEIYIILFTILINAILVIKFGINALILKSNWVVQQGGKWLKDL